MASKSTASSLTCVSQSSALYTVVPLTRDYRLDKFTCGDPRRDVWLQRRAMANQESGDSRTYVLIQSGVILGFYALAVGSVVRTLLPGALRRNAPDPVSTVVLAQLAVSTSHQGKGLSRSLLLHAMGQTLKVGEIAGCRAMVVHPATADLVGYYARFGFVLASADPPFMAMSLGQVQELWKAI